MKQIIIMRTDLNMRKGKMVAQGAHASVMGYQKVTLTKSNTWFENGMKKICVGIGSLEELLSLAEQAEIVGLSACIVTDRGDTEFHGVPTVTCAAIGPDEDAKIDAITGGLKLL